MPAWLYPLHVVLQSDKSPAGRGWQITICAVCCSAKGSFPLEMSQALAPAWAARRSRVAGVASNRSALSESALVFALMSLRARRRLPGSCALA